MSFFTSFWSNPEHGGSPTIQAPPAARLDALNSDIKIRVRRDGCLVNIALISDDEVRSIKLHAYLVQSIRNGSVTLDIEA